MISLCSSPFLALWLATATVSFLVGCTTAESQEIEAFPCQGTETRFSIITTLLGIFGTEHCSVLRDDDSKMLFQCYYESDDYTATADLLYTNEVTHLTVVDSDHKGREDWTFPSKDTIKLGTDIDNMYHNSRDNDLIESACLEDMTYLADVRDRIGGREDEALPPADDPLPSDDPADAPWTVLFTLYEIFGRKNCAKQLGEEKIKCGYAAPGGTEVSATFRYDVDGVDLTVSEVESDDSTSWSEIASSGAYEQFSSSPPCEGLGFETGVSLTVTVVTDKWASESSWEVDSWQWDREWVTDVAKQFTKNSHAHVDQLCLPPDNTYRWILSDYYGDGIVDDEGGDFELELNGEVILSYMPFVLGISHKFNAYSIACLRDSKILKETYSEIRGFTTPSPSDSPSASPSRSNYPSASPTAIPTAIPTASPTVSPTTDPTNAPTEICINHSGSHDFELREGKTYSKECSWLEQKIETQGEKKGQSLCKKPLTSGEGQLFDKCPVTCATVGKGPCAE